jgi:hypothetical protein
MEKKVTESYNSLLKDQVLKTKLGSKNGKENFAVGICICITLFLR